jgi:rhodanese-related sulfurtransferase
VFTGDTLLIGGCGRTDFQNGSADALWHSITEKLFRLDEQTLVYPAHDYKGRRVSSIGEEKRFNARVAGKTREEFLSVMNNLNLPMPARIQEAVPANLEGGGQPAGAPAQWASPAVAVQSVSATQLAEVLGTTGAHLLDVRTPQEFNAVRIAGAVNVPLDRLDPAALLASLGSNDPVYVVCQTGTRSQFAAAELRAAGFHRVVHVDGGTNAWTVAGLPVERGSPVTA